MDTAFRSDERFTQEEFSRWLLDRPERDVNHYELIRGQIVMSPPAGWPHGGVEATLVRHLGQHVVWRQLGLVQGSSAGYDLPSGDTLEPDVFFLSTARRAVGPAPVRGRFLRIVPDLAIEILSDSTANRDRREKKDIYAENGVDEYWLVDTDRREITVFHREGRTFALAEPALRGRAPSRVLPDLELCVEEVFADAV